MTTVHVRRLDEVEWPRYADEIVRIEQTSFAGESRDAEVDMRAVVEHRRAVCYVALVGGVVAGYCLGGPLEAFGHLRGVEDDPRLGAGDVLYAASLAVDDRFRGQGIARRLKRSQIVGARRSHYRWIAGRNRQVVAAAMWRLNRSFGARPIAIVRDAYADGPAPRDCVYYHIDLESVAQDPTRFRAGLVQEGTRAGATAAAEASPAQPEVG